jgi:hypothetical protein
VGNEPSEGWIGDDATVRKDRKESEVCKMVVNGS